MTFNKRQRIEGLIIFANPGNTSPLSLGMEDRAIQQAIQLSSQRDKILLTSHHAVTVHDLRRVLLNSEFQIVHISAHGVKKGIVLEDELGEAKTASFPALASLFQSYSPPIQCVILNACHSATQGQLISLGVPYTIAMEGPINDKAAIEFSRGFYDAIGAGKSYKSAYKEGCRAVTLAAPDALFVPSFFSKDETSF